MHIAVISDLHLGRGDVADRFRHEDGIFLRFLDHLERHFDRIVLLGDVWETLGSRRPGDAAAELRRARAAHPRLADRFCRSRYAYVHGNHDLVARRVDRAPEELTIQADGVRLLFTHGHLHDWLVQRWNALAEVGSWIGGVLLRQGQAPLFRLLDRAHTRSQGCRPDPARCSFRRWALSLAGARSADVVVTGHTHLAAVEDYGSRLFLNSGSCADGRFEYLALDTRSGRYEVGTDPRGAVADRTAA
jgi:predicted phosphodiesterase